MARSEYRRGQGPKQLPQGSATQLNDALRSAGGVPARPVSSLDIHRRLGKEVDLLAAVEGWSRAEHRRRQLGRVKSPTSSLSPGADIPVVLAPPGYEDQLLSMPDPTVTENMAILGAPPNPAYQPRKIETGAGGVPRSLIRNLPRLNDPSLPWLSALVEAVARHANAGRN